MDCSTSGLPVLHCLPELAKLVSIESVMPSSHLILCRPLLLSPPVLQASPNTSVSTTSVHSHATAYLVFLFKWTHFLLGLVLSNNNLRNCGLDMLITYFYIHQYTMFKVKVAQSCLTLCDPVDYTVHGILQARILEWVAFPFSRGSSLLRDRTQVSRIAGRFFTS